MGEPDPYYAALRRSVEAKRRMNAAQAELDKAEDEWHQACRALDELENAPCEPATSG